MTEKPPTRIWARIGQIAVILTVLWTSIQIFSKVTTTEFAMSAEGRCAVLSLPQVYQTELASIDLPIDEIKKKIPQDSTHADSLAIDFQSLFLEKKNKMSDVFSRLKALSSTCIFTITNTGTKELQDANLELPREGVYSLEQLGQANKNDRFERIITLGKLNPGGTMTVHTWNKYRDSLENYEKSAFRITHTNGITQVTFPSQTDTFLGGIYENYPYISLAVIAIAGIGLFVWGVSVGSKDERGRLLSELRSAAEAENVVAKARESDEEPTDIASPS